MDSHAEDINEVCLSVGADWFELLAACDCGGPVARLHWTRLPAVAARVSIHQPGCPQRPDLSIDEQLDQLSALPAHVEGAHLEHLWTLS